VPGARSARGEGPGQAPGAPARGVQLNERGNNFGWGRLVGCMKRGPWPAFELLQGLFSVRINVVFLSLDDSIR